MTTRSQRILVVADDPLARAGLSALLAEQTDQTVTGQVASVDLSTSLPVYAPDVIVWDMGWNVAVALERLAALSIPDGAELPGVPVIALLADEPSAAEAWQAGARGLFLRTTRLDKVIAAFEAVIRGLIVIDPALGGLLIARRERLSAPSGDAPLAADLTLRETEALQWMAQGLPNKGIAQKMGISESTVKFYVNAILGKLGAQRSHGRRGTRHPVRADHFVDGAGKVRVPN